MNDEEKYSQEDIERLKPIVDKMLDNCADIVQYEKLEEFEKLAWSLAKEAFSEGRHAQFCVEAEAVFG